MKNHTITREEIEEAHTITLAMQAVAGTGTKRLNMEVIPGGSIRYIVKKAGIQVHETTQLDTAIFEYNNTIL